MAEAVAVMIVPVIVAVAIIVTLLAVAAVTDDIRGRPSATTRSVVLEDRIDEAHVSIQTAKALEQLAANRRRVEGEIRKEMRAQKSRPR